MEERKNCPQQIEIDDLIGDAIANAVTRRGLVETLSDEEATSIAGGLTEEQKAILIKRVPTVAGFKPIQPTCPPVKPICPPIVVGLIYLPEDERFPVA